MTALQAHRGCSCHVECLQHLSALSSLESWHRLLRPLAGGGGAGRPSRWGTYHIWYRKSDCSGLCSWHSSRAALLSLIRASSLWLSSGRVIAAWQGHSTMSTASPSTPRVPVSSSDGRGAERTGVQEGTQPGGACRGAFGGNLGPPSETCSHEPTPFPRFAGQRGSPSCSAVA